MSQIVTILPLQEQIILRGERKVGYTFSFEDIYSYLMDTRGFSSLDLDEYNMVELVEGYMNDPLEVEVCAIYSGKAATMPNGHHSDCDAQEEPYHNFMCSAHCPLQHNLGGLAAEN